MPVINRIAADAQQLTEWRRDLHMHPEIGLEEHRTSQIVADKLASWGIEVTRGLAGTARSTLIVNFPGSPKAIDEVFGVVGSVLKHAVATLHGDHRH